MIPISRQDGKPFRLIDYFSGLLDITQMRAGSGRMRGERLFFELDYARSAIAEWVKDLR
ncbi:hypothetical protein [Paracoccus yeei]|uniref:hypothetical protein n=1 Tax=Paracoccus yeei TaxID=147645 RepID=UPI003BF87C13